MALTGIPAIFVVVFIFEVCAEMQTLQNGGLDIFHALNLTNSTKGVQAVVGLNQQAWRFHSSFSDSILSQDSSQNFLSSLIDTISFEFIYKQNKNSSGSLIVISNPGKSSPWIRIVSNVKTGNINILYTIENSNQRHHLTFVKQLPIIGNQWIRFLLVLQNDLAKLFINCEVRIVKALQGRINLNILKDSLIYFRQGPGSTKKLQGSFQVAKIYDYGFIDPPWNCSVEPESAAGVTRSSLAVSSINKTPGFLQDAISKDICEDKIYALEQMTSRLHLEIRNLNEENMALNETLQHYEDTCTCPTPCFHEGRLYQEGEAWEPDACSMCICQHSKAHCQVKTYQKECTDPCYSNPCINGGTCFGYSGFRNYTCKCPYSYIGKHCEIRINCCIYPKSYGTCHSSEKRYFYNIYNQQCEEFYFSGCGGTPNNFLTLSDCKNTCVMGACCYRTLSLTISNQVDVHPGQIGYRCEERSSESCRSLHYPQFSNQMEVLSFSAGQTCNDVLCGVGKTCSIGEVSYQHGDNFQLGCEKCNCLSGIIHCRCLKTMIRKEIRDMTQEEIHRFHSAIKQLKLSGPQNVWDQFRNIYIRHAMHSHGTMFFLPWHRYYLYLIEKKLREIDCGITLPYFDFSTDAGDFKNAIIWQPNYYGGDGKGDCVPDHPFQDSQTSWQPCLKRKFNSDIQIPSILELALAISSDNFTEMSQCLEIFVGYVHNFVGGHLSTVAAPYDPLFYAFHTFIDMLWWSWQKKFGINTFPREYLDIPMSPFNIPPRTIVNSDHLCITYALPSLGHPCNDTSISYGIDGYNINNLNRQGFDREGYDSGGYNSRGYNRQGEYDSRNIYIYDGFDNYGYNREGYDHRGYDRYGFNKEGFNRDGFNIHGYDRQGFNRYGLDQEGYDRRGYNQFGIDRNGLRDTKEGISADCIDREGLNPKGLDKFGFDIHGYDIHLCNYSFQGPFALLHSYRVWEILHKQSKSFLMTLPRTCIELEPLPITWYQQFWIVTPKDVSGLVTSEITQSQSSLSQQFCFNLDIVLSNCPCEGKTILCPSNPCWKKTCNSYPEAVCEIDFCDKCEAKWVYQGQVIDCSTPPVKEDGCKRNPCQNGGTCQPSRWPNQPELVTCICPLGFDGHLCQYVSQQVCYLPKVSGNCEQQHQRWFFNFYTNRCEQFIYSGCKGNANNFQTEWQCRLQCEIGACCFRTPLKPSFIHGYSREGFDRYGFNIKGFDKFGQEKQPHNSFGGAYGLYNEHGYDSQGYDRHGFDFHGYDHHGYDRRGFNVETGFNLTGYNLLGDYDGIIDYNEHGFDSSGYNRAGFNCYGYNREGFNYFGLSGGFHYECRSMTLQECQNIEKLDPKLRRQVIKFSPGTQCSDVDCKAHCGCKFNGKLYKFEEEFRYACQICRCTRTGIVICDCSRRWIRKEFRDLTREEMKRYQNAIKHLQTKTNYPSKWQNFANIYFESIPQASGSDQFLPWHRYFLRLFEMELQKIDCSITIPYFDWTIDSGSMITSAAWQANNFGGNGEKDTECVRYHPFKDFHPPYWNPCLRRNFNLSIHLPDFLNLQFISNEPTYEQFRLQLESASSLFRVWVGGHMATQYSAYDPIFYSHFAFIDKLWMDWQTKYYIGVSKYPPEKRYLLIAPFGVSPDEVLASEIQVCVSYIDVTIGALCNDSNITEFGYDKQGYDRHGYNRQGYDRDGFNIAGFNQLGQPDNRGIYNVDGFDREGYHRNGYDISGFDRYGFFTDTFNRDGFDGFGYDYSGYDRYGFDKDGVTPFGFHSSGKWSNEVIQTVLFDEGGYSKYGYDIYGRDPEGYDVFGFDSRGYDKDNCNYYFLGPMYLRYKIWVHNRLKNLSDIDLAIIERICPDVSAISDWWITNYWLNRDHQQVLIKDIEKTWFLEHPVNKNYVPPKSSITNERLWIPITPDERFCFKLDYYSNCPLGSKTVICPEDLCRGKTCSSNPNAFCKMVTCDKCSLEWYDRRSRKKLQCLDCFDTDMTVRSDGSRWQQSTCKSCICQQGTITCFDNSESCPVVSCMYPIQRPGECCPQCSGCLYYGKEYANGMEFQTENYCKKCICFDGNVQCSNIICDVLRCEKKITLPGTCCPQCEECIDRGNGSTWDSPPCKICSCIHGHPVCEDKKCAPVHCRNPVTVPGSCCPICRDCWYGGQIIRHGDRFQPNDLNSCICMSGNVQCEAQECPPISCRNPTKLPGKCPVCPKGCEYDGRYFEDRQTFIPSFNPCLNCTCLDSSVKCRTIHCPTPNLPCARPVSRHGECCPTQCPLCTQDGVEYIHGQEWTSRSDPCKRCKCSEGSVSCYPKQTCSVECTHGIVQPGHCCSQCTDCIIGGQVIQNGLTFARSGDVCVQCTCQNGNIVCNSPQQCPPLPCRGQETLPGSCCPICKGCTDEYGVRHEHNTQWENPSDSCQICLCMQGHISCNREECKVHCRHPVHRQNKCCPECEGCMYNNFIYANQAVVASTDPCEKCTCYYGNVECETINCEDVSCTRPYRPPGECCQVCDDCLYESQSYPNGQTFISSRNPCLRCTCRNGRVDCDRLDLTCNPQCTHPGRVRDQCCPICDGCEYERRNYRNGQEFNPPDADECFFCKCQNGFVTCATKVCPPLDCPNPEKSPGECCPKCPPSCVVRDKEYKDGDHWIDPDDQCSECTCVRSYPRCTTRPCPPSSCSHPARIPNSCCPVCDMCEFTRRLFRNGHQFLHPDDPCQECICHNGTVTCNTIVCIPQLCKSLKHVDGKCCPECESRGDCEYFGRHYDNRATFLNLQNTCEDCMCIDGQVTCMKRGCPLVHCHNPQKGECCEMCAGCSYHNRNYPEYETFTDPLDKCRKCTCIGGNIQCMTKMCPQVNCHNPVTQPGECCPTCQEKQEFRECVYNAKMYSSGEIFIDPIDSCKECHCLHSDVVCRAKACPDVFCSHPARGQCCSECNDCLFDGRLFRNGGTFEDPRDSCHECTCKDGNVKCQRRLCLNATCSHPVQGHCCLECVDCTYGNIRFLNGQTFPDYRDDCNECTCRNGEVNCRPKPCPPVSCTHPFRTECCEQCYDCFYNQKFFPNGYTFQDTRDSCQECQCRGGNVHCTRKVCPPVMCSNPIQGACCPECPLGVVPGCNYDGQIYAEGQHFRDSADPCYECQCYNGNIQCYNHYCPDPPPCLDPSPGCIFGCAPCSTCNFLGIHYPDGAELPPERGGGCETCTCYHGNIQCNPGICQPLLCANQIIPEHQCCPICTAQQCVFENKYFQEGEVWIPPHDKCQRCSCSVGQVFCQVIQCPVCSHPKVNPDECCPTCSQCNYLGETFADEAMFTPARAPCEKCACNKGNVVCTPVACPMVRCTKFITKEGHCCPQCADENGCEFQGQYFDSGTTFANPANLCEMCICLNSKASCSQQVCPQICTHPLPDRCCPTCDGCFFENKIYANGESFNPDPCRNCVCKDGNVQCQSEQCPSLTCALKMRVPGKCCEVCRDCMYDGQEFSNGISWISDNNPCMSCQCQGGVVTCAEIRCITPCANPIPIPGQCCPICPSCELNGKQYEDGETFTPNGNPCDTCTCEHGNLRCFTQQCPSLLDCQPSQVLPPREGECCPACAGLSTNCTDEHQGMVLHPTDDPCFTCECKDGSSWICMEEVCDPIHCPESEKFTPTGECCPKCNVCYFEDKDITYQNGERWLDPDDSCKICDCDAGRVTCVVEKCPNISCNPGEIEHKSTGDCCAICVQENDFLCKYGNQIYQDGQEWNVNECTMCQCIEGETKCITQQCLPLDCQSDEAPTLDPGECCPRCIPKPGTCLAFGDPHYRTFDGNILHFQGTCKYVMASDCVNGDFTIEVQNNDRGKEGVAWTDSVTVHVGSVLIVELMQNHSVTVNGQSVQLPFLREPYIQIEQSKSALLLITNQGMTLVWNGDSYLEVSVPGSYKGKMCGLCGNFNSFQQDDMRTRTGIFATSEAVFGNSWKALGEQQSTCKEARDIDPCSEAGYRARKAANAKCSILKGELFSRCHGVIPPEPYYASCVYDMCACSENDDCLCDILTTYSMECAQARVILKWRTATLCAIKCAEDSGLIFDECGPPCPRTCENKHVSLGNITEQCFKPCVPGCQCSADKVLHDNKCIKAEDCPK